MLSRRYRGTSVMKPRATRGNILRLVLVLLSFRPCIYFFLSLVILLLTFARHPLLTFHFLRLNLAAALRWLFFVRALSCPVLSLCIFFNCAFSIFKYKKAASFIS